MGDFFGNLCEATIESNPQELGFNENSMQKFAELISVYHYNIRQSSPF